MPNFKFIHISDLHLNVMDSDTSGLSKKIIEERNKIARIELAHFIRDNLNLKLNENETLCDYIFITGDIAYKGIYPSKEQFDADPLFISLKNAVPNDSSERIFWACGNHDFNRKSTDMLTNYHNYYWSVTKQNVDDIKTRMHNFKEKKDFNLIILNTNSKSDEDDILDVIYSSDGEKQIKLNSSSLISLFTNRNKKIPTIVIGHHGISWFDNNTKNILEKLFDNEKVDFYLCGHEHRLGYNRFENSKKDIHQLTCGGCMHDGYSVFSFIYGEYRNGLYHLTPYAYRFDGNSNWVVDYELHRKIRQNNIFMRTDYEELIQQCFFELWEKNIEIDEKQLSKLWRTVWTSCLDLLQVQTEDIDKEMFAQEVINIIKGNFTAYYKENDKQKK